MIEAVLFDFDGTLINSEYFHFECWNEVLNEYNISITWERYLNEFAGIPTPANAALVIEEYSLDITVEELTEVGENLSAERLKSAEIQLMPYALETIQLFTDIGFPLAIVTGSPRNNVEVVLENTGLGKYFEATVTRNDVVNSKPDPESYLRGVEKLGLDPHQYIVFEDTENGVKSAKSAGLQCFAIQSNEQEHPKLQIADQVFVDLKTATDHLFRNNLIH